METEYVTNRRRAAGRLPRLARFLRGISKEINGMKFDLGEIARGGTPRTTEEAKHCGFEGCALGYAPLEPSFKKAGLRLMEITDGDGYSNIEVYHRDAPRGDDTNQRVSFDTAEWFFGIDERASAAIFGWASDDWRNGEPVRSVHGAGRLDGHDPIAAAERIERFCRDNDIPI